MCGRLQSPAASAQTPVLLCSLVPGRSSGSRPAASSPRLSLVRGVSLQPSGLCRSRLAIEPEEWRFDFLRHGDSLNALLVCCPTTGRLEHTLISDQILDISIPAKNNTQHLLSQVFWSQMGIVQGWLLFIRHILQSGASKGEKIDNCSLRRTQMNLISQS